MNLTDKEMLRYEKLVKSFPDRIFVKPLDIPGLGLSNPNKNKYTYYDVLSTRYLYMKIFGSIPPEDIWGLQEILNPGNVSTTVTIEPNISNLLIDIIIGSSEQEQLVVTNKKMIGTNTTIGDIIESINSDCICLGPQGIIDPGTKIESIDSLKSGQLIVLNNF